MAVRQIFEHDIPELEFCSAKFAKPCGNGSLTHLTHTHHPDIGAFSISNLVFQQMFLLDVQWSLPDDVIIHESNPSATVDINFVLEGNLKGNFRNLAAEFAMRTGTHNMKYTPSEKSSHHVVRQDTKMFVVSIEKDYFRELIGHDNSWAEGIQKRLERDESFLASKTFIPQTPQMQALIHSIRNMQPGPMSRLLTQSMIFELMARQMDQLRSIDVETKPVDDISTDDKQKLCLIKDYIDTHFLEDFTVTSLCRQALLNEFKLKKGFKALYGKSVIQYARELRMQYAQSMLRDHRMSIEEVSTLLRYQYPNHFSAAYKKFFGISPSVR